jgi:Leucine-rich repeat (LRR) protein
MRIFERNKNIYSLDLSSNKLPSNPFALEMLFKPLFNLSTLTVRSVAWYIILYQLLHILPNLNSLDMSDNRIEYIGFDASLIYLI